MSIPQEGTMDNDDDEILFDFRDPSYSDEDEDFSDSDSVEEVDTEEDEEFMSSGSDRSTRAINTEYPQRRTVGETSGRTDTFLYVQPSDLQKSLQAGISLLEGQQVGEEGTSTEHEGASPGSASKVGDPDNSLSLREDLRQVLSRLVDEKDRPEVFQGGAATVFDELPADTSQTYPENPDKRQGKLPIRKRITISSHEGEASADPELGYRERIANQSQEHSVTTPEERLDEIAAGSTRAVDGAASTETQVPVSRTDTSQEGMIHTVAQLHAKEESMAKSDAPPATVIGQQPDHTGVSVRSDIPAERTEELQRVDMLGGEHKEEESTATSSPQNTVTGPPRETSSAAIQGEFHRVLSVREKLQARVRKSEENESSCVCSRCGVQQNLCLEGYICKICSYDKRNFPPFESLWISPKELKDLNLKNCGYPLEAHLYFQISTTPKCFQANRAIFLKLPNGNILWDCLAYIDEETVIEIAKKGGLKAIALSSPERIGSCARMSYIFNRCRIYLHKRDFLTKTAGKRARKFWSDRAEYLWDGVTLIQLGGHFQGSCILHLDHKGGVVFSSNTLKVGADRNSVSVMLHYGNYIPAPPKDVRRILHIMEELEFDQLLGDQFGEDILEEAKPKVISSLKRYLRWTQHDEDAIDFETRPLSRREFIARGKRKVDEI